MLELENEIKGSDFLPEARNNFYHYLSVTPTNLPFPEQSATDVMLFPEYNESGFYNGYPISYEVVRESVETSQELLFRGGGENICRALNLLETEMKTTANGISEFSGPEIDKVRTLYRLTMVNAIARRIAGHGLESLDLFRESMRGAIETRDLPLLIELERHWTNLELDNQHFNYAVYRALVSLALSESSKRRGDSSWITSGVLNAIKAHPRRGSLETIKLLWYSGYLRNGFIKMIFKKS